MEEERFSKDVLSESDPWKRQALAIQWMAENPDSLAREWDTAAEGLDVCHLSASSAGDATRLEAVMLAKAWMAALLPARPGGGGQGAEMIRSLDPHHVSHEHLLEHLAFVVAMVQPMVMEDADAAIRRMKGSYFNRQRDWFKSNYPHIAQDVDQILGRRDALAAELSSASHLPTHESGRRTRVAS